MRRKQKYPNMNRKKTKPISANSEQREERNKNNISPFVFLLSHPFDKFFVQELNEKPWMQFLTRKMIPDGKVQNNNACKDNITTAMAVNKQKS